MTKKRLGIFLVALALVAAACGESDGISDQTTSTTLPAPTTTTSTTQPPTPATTTTTTIPVVNQYVRVYFLIPIK